MLKNLVEETANNPGTGTTVTLAGAPAGRLTWRASGFANGAAVFYFITDGTIGEWGIGTLNLSASDTLTRTTVISNTSGTTSRLNFTGACRVYNAMPAERAIYVGQGAVTLDGDLTIAKATPQIKVDKTGAAQAASIVGARSGALRWSLNLGSSTIETGLGNVGSDFTIARYNDAGTFISTVFTISRATGAVSTSGTLTVGGLLTASAGAAVVGNLSVTGQITAPSAALTTLTVGGASLWDPGDIKTTVRTEPTAGWLFCDGASYATSLYPALFAAIGYTFGGSGGNFNVPDFRGRTPFGKDDMGGSAASRLTTAGGGVDGATLGAVGGAQNHTLTTAQIPSHNHTGNTDTHGGHAHTGTTDSNGAHAHDYSNPSNFGGGTVYLQGGTTYGQATLTTSTTGAHTHTFTTAGAGAHSHALTTDFTGGGAAHQQIPPAIVCNYVIKT